MAYDGTGAAGGGAPPGAAGVKVASCVVLFAYGRTGCALVGHLDPKGHPAGVSGPQPLPGVRRRRGDHAAVPLLLRPPRCGRTRVTQQGPEAVPSGPVSGPMFTL